MRLLAALLLLSAAALAQPSGYPTGVSVAELGDVYARLGGVLPAGAEDVQTRVAPASLNSGANPFVTGVIEGYKHGSTGSGGWRNANALRLTPASEYYVDFAVYSSNGQRLAPFVCPNTCDDGECSSSHDAYFADDSGLSCPVAGEPPRFTTAALESLTPIPPQAPVHTAFAGDAWTIGASYDGLTLTSNAADLQADIDAVAAADLATPGQRHRIGLAPGVHAILTTIELPRLSEGAELVIESDYAVAALKPAKGVQLDPLWRQHMARLVATGYHFEGANPVPPRQFVDGRNAQGITFSNVSFEMADPLEVAPNQVAIAGVSGLGATTITIDTAQPHGLQKEHYVTLDLGPGVSGSGGGIVSSVVDSDTFTVRSRDSSPTLAWTGTWGGTGTVTQAWAIPITQCFDSGSAGPIRCDTDVPHGLATHSSDRPWLTVSEVQGLNANGTWAYTAIDADTVELTGSAASGTYAVGDPDRDYLVLHGGRIFNWLHVSNADDIRFVQCYFRAGQPYRIAGVINANGVDGFALVGSFFDQLSFWRPIRDGQKDFSITSSAFTGQMTVASFEGAHDYYVDNITVYQSYGITFFQDSGDVESTDVTFSNVVVFIGGRVRSYQDGAANEDGRYAHEEKGKTAEGRHCIESKGSKRLKIDGFACLGNYSSAEISNGVFHFTTIPATASRKTPEMGFQDLDVSNVISQSFQGIYWYVAVNPSWPRTPFQRFRFDNIVFDNSGMYWRSSPVCCTGNAELWAFVGYTFRSSADIVDLSISRTTVYADRGPSTGFLSFSNGVASRAQIDDAIILYHESGSSISPQGEGPISLFSNAAAIGWTPIDTSSYGALWEAACSPYCGISDTLFLGGVTTPAASVAAWPSKSAAVDDATTVDEDEMQTALTGDLAEVNGNLHYGPAGVSLDDRLETVFGDDFQADGVYSGYGADVQEIHDALRYLSNVAVERSATKLRLSYTTAEAGPLTCQFWVGESFTAVESVSDSGSSPGLRQCVSNDFPPGSTIRWKIAGARPLYGQTALAQ